MNKYKTFISFLEKNIKSNNELDMIIYNIGTVQRIAEQFSYFFNKKIEQKKDNSDIVDLEIEFEVECNEKIHLALGLGDSGTLFIECDCQYHAINDGEALPIFFVNINKELIAALTLEGMRNEL